MSAPIRIVSVGFMLLVLIAVAVFVTGEFAKTDRGKEFFSKLEESSTPKQIEIGDGFVLERPEGWAIESSSKNSFVFVNRLADKPDRIKALVFKADQTQSIEELRQRVKSLLQEDGSAGRSSYSLGFQYFGEGSGAEEYQAENRSSKIVSIYKTSFSQLVVFILEVPISFDLDRSKKLVDSFTLKPAAFAR